MIDKLHPDNGTTSQIIVQTAQKWIGTPYIHQASLIGVGTDCLGLVRGVWRELYGGEPQHVPPYSADWGEVGQGDPLLTAARSSLEEHVCSQAIPGDVLIFRMRSDACAKHCAFLSNNNRMIHAYSNHAVCEVAFTPAWKRRLAAVFRFPNILEAV